MRARRNVDRAVAVVIEEGRVPLQRGVARAVARFQLARHRVSLLTFRFAREKRRIGRLTDGCGNAHRGSIPGRGERRRITGANSLTPPTDDMSGGSWLMAGCWLARPDVSAQRGPAPGSGSHYGVETTA